MKRIKYISIVIVAIFAIAYLYADKLTSLIYSTSNSAIRGSVNTQAALGNITFVSKSDLLSENKKLKESLSEFAFLRVYNKALEYELNEIKDLLGDQQVKGVLARTINAQQIPTPSFLKISVKDDIKTFSNPYAFAKGGFVLGEVQIGNGNVHFVNLFSTPGRELPGYLRFDDKNSPSDKLSVDVVALGSGAFEFFVNKEYKVKKGDILFFKTYPMAVVEKVNESSQSPFLRVWARLPFDMSLVDYVLIKDI